MRREKKKTFLDLKVELHEAIATSAKTRGITSISSIRGTAQVQKPEEYWKSDDLLGR